jgi:predicted DNA binding CopG/RHH family protein
MEPQNIQIAPEIIQAITREATARGLSVDEYLRQALGVMNRTPSSERM